ncbi:hypothetical protein D3C78_1653920 [compost metagenome]
MRFAGKTQLCQQLEGNLLHGVRPKESIQSIGMHLQILVTSPPGAYHCPQQGLQLRFVDDHGLALPMAQL